MIDVNMTVPVFRAIEVLILERVRQIDETECNNATEAAKMRDERTLLLQGLCEMLVTR